MFLFATQLFIIIGFCVKGAYENSFVTSVRDNIKFKPEYREKIPKELQI